MSDLLEATYFKLEHDFMYNYKLQLIDDVRTAMTYRDISHDDLILVEIYKHFEFDGYLMPGLNTVNLRIHDHYFVADNFRLLHF